MTDERKSAVERSKAAQVAEDLLDEALDGAWRCEFSLVLDLIDDLERERDEAMALAEELSAWADTNAYDVGYGFYHPEDPRDFDPDPECCSEEEIEAHREACEAWEKAGGKPDGWERPGTSGSSDDGTVHVCKTAWGIGVYRVANPEIVALRDRLAALLDREGSEG